MVYFLQPVALFTEQVVTTLVMFDFDVDQVVGMPDNLPTMATAPTATPAAELVPVPTLGDCVEVCGANDCDYLVAVPGLNKNGELSLSERVVKDIFGDDDELSSQKAAWGPVSHEKCEARKKLRKRQWYLEPYGQEYDDSYTQTPDHYLAGQDPYVHQYEELPLDYYGPREYDQFHKTEPKLSPQPKNRQVSPQTEQTNRNVKITNEVSSSIDGKDKKNNDDRINAALTDPPRRTVGAASPATKPNPVTKSVIPAPALAPKQNLNKGSTRRYPIGSTTPKGRQSSTSEAYSTDPLISYHSAPSPEADVPVQPDANAQNPEYKYGGASEAAPQEAPQAASQQAPQDASTPRIQKIEHPDGSIEYTFGVTSGEVSVYNEGEAPRKPNRQKSVISSLKSQLGIDGDISRAGWMRKRHLVPENKPSAKNVQEKIIGEDGLELKESVQSQRTPNQKADFMRANGNRTPPKKQAPPKPAQAPPTPPPPQPQQPEEGSVEAEAEAEQEILDQQKSEFERLRRLSLKQYYRDTVGKGGEGAKGQGRDKEVEKKITEEAERVAAENAQKKREERERKLKEKEPKAEDSQEN